MEISIPDDLQNINLIFQKRKMKIFKIEIIKKDILYQINICQFFNNEKFFYKKTLDLYPISLIKVLFSKEDIKIVGFNIKNEKSNYISINNKNQFIYYNRIFSNSNLLNFINHRQKIENINENTFLYYLKEKYDPKYDFQLILNNLNLIKPNDFIQGKRKNNTYSFHIKIEKNDKEFNLIINNQDENGNWNKKREFKIQIEDEKLNLKFHKSYSHLGLSINVQKSFIIPISYFYDLKFEEINTSLHDAILMLPDEEQVIFKKDGLKKPIKFWINKKRYNENVTIFQFINVENKGNNFSSLQDEFQTKLKEKWINEMKGNEMKINEIKNFCLFNLNPIKKILYFSRGYGRHRFGWDYVCKEVFLNHMGDNPNGILLDPFVEATFLWKISQGDFFYNQDWVGFIHSSPTTPIWYNSSKNSLMDLIQNKNFNKSLPNCKALIVLSNHLKDALYYRLKYLKNIIIPIFTIYHPVGNTSTIFNIDNYERKSVLHIGLHLRNFGSFYLLNNKIKKYLIVPTEINWKEECYQFIIDEIKKTIFDLDLSVEQFKKEIKCLEKHKINDNKYDQLLSKHILFCDFYDSSANNLIVECIMSQTPILVNKNPAVIEYLGNEYPFYFNDIDEANKKVIDEELIIKTHHYLKGRQEIISINTFKKEWGKIMNLIDSQIS